jgi:2,4-dienoyl-CoA reductase-like NADH-dependent reductase (Old Yellow Enzyme family)
MTEHVLSRVLKPATAGGFHLKNRVAMAPLTRSRPGEADISPRAHGYVVLPAGLATNFAPTRRAVVEQEELQ